MNSDNAKGAVILGVGLLGLFVAYKLYKTGTDAVNAVSHTVSDLTEGVAETAHKLAAPVVAAYEETKNFFTGNQSYSPSAIDAQMSVGDATRLARAMDEKIALENKRIDEREAAMKANTGTNPMGDYTGDYE